MLLSVYEMKKGDDKTLSVLGFTDVGALPKGAGNFLYQPLAQTLVSSCQTNMACPTPKLE
jgi:hypothetical protein